MSTVSEEAVAAVRPTTGWLARIERLGNALPDPIALFAGGAALVFLASWLASALGWTCTFADESGAVLRSEQARNLLSAEGLRWLATNLVSIFVQFRPLGLVLCVSIGVAVAERSGLISSALRAALVYVPRALLTPVTLLVGILSTLAADAGFIVLPPLAAVVYASVGRSPVLGIAAVTAGVAMGFGSNVFLTTQDPMLSGLTEAAARLLDPQYTVSPASNWYFKIASTIVLVLTGWLVSVRWVEPAFARRRGATPAAPTGDTLAPIAPRERSGLGLAAFATAAVLVFLLASALAPWGFLHDAPPEPGASATQPTWIASIVALLVLVFLVPGLAYGVWVGTIRSSRDVARMMGEYLGMLGGYVVMAFFAAILVAAFERSNLGVMLAIAGGNELRALDLPRWTLFLALIALSSSIDLLVVSMSAKWALLATVVVPMFMTLGISPELTQATYRIGDSITNPISPLNPYLYVVLALMRRHEPGCGFGTLLALMLPYSLAFAVAWIALLMAWIAFGWPLGPDGPLVYPHG